jgi:hypothetical protein
MFKVGEKSASLTAERDRSRGRILTSEAVHELLPKVAEEAEFRKWCDRRRYAAREQGKRFRSSFDWIFWPREEIFETLRSRSRTLSLHGIHDLAEMVDVRYRVLRGDPARVAALIPVGESC